MISGKKCRHLNRAGVDIGGRKGKARSVYLTTYQFLRHNLNSQNFDESTLIQRIESLERQQRALQETVQKLKHDLEQLMESKPLEGKDASALIAPREDPQPPATTATAMGNEALQFLQPMSAEELLQRIGKGEKAFMGANLRGLDLNQWDLRTASFK
jgi:chromosome segregation ATPase